MMDDLNLDPGPDYVLRGHRDSVNALCFLSENELASGSGDGVVKIWNLASRRPIVEVKASETSSVLSLSHIQQDNFLISCSRDGIVNVWDTDTTNSSGIGTGTGTSTTPPLTSFYCGVGHFCNAATDRSQRDCNTLVTPTSEESQIIIWDLRVGSGLSGTGGSSSSSSSESNGSSRGVTSKAVGCIETDKSKGMLSSLHYNSSVVRCLQDGGSSSSHVPSSAAAREKDSDDDSDDDDDEREEEKATASNIPSPSSCSSSSSSSSGLLLAGFESGGVTSFDLRTGRVLCEHSPHQDPVMTLDSFSPCPPPPVSPPSTTVFLSAPLPDTPTHPSTSSMTSSAASSKTRPSTCTSTMVATGGAGSQLCLLRDFNNASVSVCGQDVSTSKNKNKGKGKGKGKNTEPLSVPLRKPGCGCVRFRPDGRLLVTGHWDHSVRIFSTKKMKPLAIMRHHSASVYAVDFAPAPNSIGGSGGGSSGSNGCFATGSKDCTIAVWSLFADAS